MLTVLLKSHDPRSNDLWKHRDRFEEHGIRCVDELPADVSYIKCEHRDVTQEIADSPGPVILECLYDSATIQPHVRKALANDKVRVLVRNSGYRDQSLHDLPLPRTDYTAYQIAQAMGLECPTTPAVRLEPNQLEKIAVCLPLMGIDAAHWKPPIPWENRLVDVHLLMTDRYPVVGGVAHTEMHRARAYEAVCGLRRVCAVAYRADVDHRYDGGKSLSLMQQSRVVVSPWGWSGWSARDYCAILSECVLVKPDTSWLKTSPDIYSPDEPCYVAHATSYVDLQERIDEILASPTSVAARTEVLRRRFVSQMHPDAIIRKWASAILERM